MRYRLSDQVKLAAFGQWDMILQTLCSLSEKETTPTKSGMPCPNCGGHDRYEFKSADDGFHMCRGCGAGAGDGLDMMMKIHGWRFPRALSQLAQFLGLPDREALSSNHYDLSRLDIAGKKNRRQATSSDQERKAAGKARRIYRSLPDANRTFPYLAKKNVGAYGIRQQHNRIVIPVKNAEGEITSLQFINADGSKRFLKGGKIKGSFHLIGEITNVVCIAEGYATAASFHEYAFMPVAVAFNAENLKVVAIALRKKYPGIRIVVLADNDRSTSGNPGLAKAKAAAQAVGGEIRLPKFKEDEPGSDFNDWINNRVRSKLWTQRPTQRSDSWATAITLSLAICISSLKKMANRKSSLHP